MTAYDEFIAAQKAGEIYKHHTAMSKRNAYYFYYGTGASRVIEKYKGKFGSGFAEYTPKGNGPFTLVTYWIFKEDTLL